MQQADETFLTTTQEPRKLSIAISRYFSGELTEPDLKERYEKFLRQRSRAAMLQIIKDGSFQEMVKLAEGGFCLLYTSVSHFAFRCYKKQYIHSYASFFYVITRIVPCFALS